MSDDKVLNKIGKGATVFILGVIISKLFGIFYKALAARTGTYNYGVLSLGIGIFGFFGALATMGLDLGVTKYIAYYRNKMEEAKIKGIITSALKLAFGVAVILSITGLILSEIISVKIFHNTDLTNVLRILFLILPLDAMRRIFIGATKAFQYVKYEIYSKDMIENAVKVSLTIIVVLMGAKLIGLSLAFAAGIVASFLMIAYFTEKKVFPIFKTKIISIKQYGELFNYSWPLMFTSLLFLLSLWTDSFLIGYFMDASMVGIFNAAGPIAFLVYQFPQALMAIFLPIITDLKAKGDIQELESLYKTITRWLFVTGLMVVTAVIIFSQDIIGLIFGENYLQATIPLMILVTGYFLNSVVFGAQRILMAYDRTKLIFLDTIISFILNISIAVVLIPKYGLIGAAIATASSFTFLSLLTLIQTRYVIKLKTFEKKYLFQLVPVIATSLGVYFLKDYLQGLFFIAGILLIPMISLIIIYFIGGFSEREIELAKSAMAKLKRNG